MHDAEICVKFAIWFLGRKSFVRKSLCSWLCLRCATLSHKTITFLRSEITHNQIFIISPSFDNNRRYKVINIVISFLKKAWIILFPRLLHQVLFVLVEHLLILDVFITAAVCYFYLGCGWVDHDVFTDWTAEEDT